MYNLWKIEYILPLHHSLMTLGSILWLLSLGYCVTCTSSKHHHEQQLFKLWRHNLQRGTRELIHDPIDVYTLFSNIGIRAMYACFHFWINDVIDLYCFEKQNTICLIKNLFTSASKV